MDAPGLFLPEVWAAHAKWRGDRVAVVCKDRRSTWGELGERMNRVANALRAAGLRKGDKVALLMTNGIEMLEIMLGAIKGGFVIVPLSSMITPQTAAMMVSDSGARALFISADLLPLAEESFEGKGAAPLCIGVGCADAGLREYEDFLASSDTQAVEVGRDPEDEFIIVYSSGTTGTPKGIVHTHRTRHHLAYCMGLELGVTDRSVVLATTALHANGTWLVLLPALLTGATIVLMDKFSPSAFLDLVAAERVTHTFMVPPQFAAILAAPELAAADLSSLGVMLSGGAPFPPETKRQAVARIGFGLHELYGCTEGIGTMIKPELILEKPGSVGLPLLGMDVAIIDEEGRVLPRGATGEIVGYGPGLMKGYHNRPEATEEAIWRDPSGRTWLRTGDIGKLDEDGCLTVLDRKKDMIVSGGYNVFAGDIEPVVAGHPDVAEVTVIGVPDQRWGEVPLALVVPRGPSADPQAIVGWANERLAKHQRIAAVEFRERFPRNALGKVLKRELRQSYWEEGGADGA
jgi:acyl-CoA synthetase (AMP-forming)/AMP-acid ligase II